MVWEHSWEEKWVYYTVPFHKCVKTHTACAHSYAQFRGKCTFIFRALLFSATSLVSPFAASRVLLLLVLWTRVQSLSWKNKFRHHTKKKSRSQTLRLGTRTKSVTHQEPFFFLFSVPAVSQALPPPAPVSVCLTWVAQQQGKAIQEGRMECGVYGQWLMSPEWWKGLPGSVLSVAPAWSLLRPLLSEEGRMRVIQQLERTNGKRIQEDKDWAKFWNNISWKIKMRPSAGNRD